MRGSIPTASAGFAKGSHASNEGPLSEQGLERLVDELLALTKRELGGT